MLLLCSITELFTGLQQFVPTTYRCGYLVICRYPSLSRTPACGDVPAILLVLFCENSRGGCHRSAELSYTALH